MKLLINTATTFKGGGVQVAKSFLEECRNFQGNEYHIILGDMLNKLINKERYPENFSFYPIGYRPATRVFSLKMKDTFFKKLEEEIKPDVVFTTTGPAYWRPRVPHLIGYNLPHYIYNESPFFDRISVTKRQKWNLKGKVIKYFFKRDADAYVVQTDDVNQRLRKWLGTNKVHTVTNTCSGYYRDPKLSENKLPEKKGSEFRFLTLSSWYAHKNLDLIPEIVSKMQNEVRERVTFVVTLPISDFNKYFPNECRDCVINTGPVKPDEGPSLYKECDALFLPTLLECFSASYAEAMEVEKPILTTDLGFARSICNDSALYFKPTDAKNAIDKIDLLIDDQELRRSLVNAGKEQLKAFDTPSERAEKYLKICEGLIS